MPSICFGNLRGYGGNIMATITFDETDWKSTTAADVSGNFNHLPAAGYVCKIVNAKITNSKAGNPMIVLDLDIAEGKFVGYFKTTQARFKNDKWSNDAVIRQVLRDKNGGVAPRFKGLIAVIEKSNPDFAFNPREFDTDKLRGQLIGCVFGAKEYRRKNGEIGVKAVAKFVCTIEHIRSGNFKIPDLEEISESNTETGGTAKGSAANTIDLEDPPF